MTGAGSADRGRAWRSAVEILALIAPIGAITGIMYYFGYVSSRAFYSHFGVSLSALDFATTSFLVRSADTLFRPVVTLLLIAGAAVGVHLLVDRALDHVGSRWSRRLAVVIAVTAAVLAAVGVVGLYITPVGATAALSLACSAILIEYGAWVSVTYAAPSAPVRTLLTSGESLRRGLLAALVLAAAFWAVTDIADDRGRATARVFELSLPLQPQAVVYSVDDLLITGPGVGTTIINGEPEGFRFRYNGLRQLLYAGGRWFLLPVGWTHDNGATLVVMPDDPAGLRVDLAP